MKTATRWNSTKLALALLTMAMVTAVYSYTGFAEHQFGEYCMALLGAAGIYSGSRTAEKFAPRSKVAEPPGDS